jgi:hypothetical protein
MPPLPLNERLNRIGQHVMRARTFFDLWFYFEGHESRHEIIHIMQEYSEFFRFAPHAYLVTCVIYMAGVFDNRGDTISLEPLIREVKAKGHLKAQDVTGVDRIFSQAKPIADKVKTLRHKAFAHQDSGISYNDVFKFAAVTPNELRELTEMALAICNSLRSACGLGDFAFSDTPREDAEAMMRTLARRAD